MESEFVNPNCMLGILHRLLPAIGPGLLVAIGYVDPGKWAATVEGGARFGYDLVVPMLIFNLAAILCQYLSALIGVVTGRDLAQICHDEYDKFTCMFLGVQTALSVIALDLTTILGIAHGLNLLFGVDLSTGVFLTAVDAVLFPLFATLLERCKANLICTCMAGFILLFYFFGVLTSQTEIPLSLNGMLTKLSGESAFALMSLLGANIIPHNFYLHSSFVLHRGPQNISKDVLCQHHFFVILCIFSGLFLVNYVLMNSAASVFNSTGLVLLTFPDAMSLMEQVFRSPVVPLAFLITLYFTNKITALTWNAGGQVVLHDFLRLDIPNWLQHATIRVIAIVPALYCLWTSGVEGIYQLLIFTQVMIALLLPSSVIPLFRVASSRPIMGAYKISQLLEFVALITFMGLLGLKILFVVEMIFGDSDWVGNLRWNMGSGASFAYIALLITACSSFSLMLWLAATPLKSATHTDALLWNWEAPNTPEPSMWRGEIFLPETLHDGEELIQSEEQLPEPRNSVESCSDVIGVNAEPNLPETIMETEQELHLKTNKESDLDVTFDSPPITYQEESTSSVDTTSVLTSVDEVVDSDLLDAAMIKVESVEPIEKTLGIEGELQAEKEDDEGDTWEPEESSKVVLGSTPSLISDGPPSFRSLSGKSDESGNGAGSLSRLAGLGRAARRQLAAVLDEFWGQLYDFHGQATQEAKHKKLDVLLADSKLAYSLLKVDTTGKEFSGYNPPVGSRGADSILNSSLCDSPKQLGVQSNMDSYGVQRGSSSLWSSHMQSLDAYVQGSSHNVVDSSERRYSRVRTLPSSDGWDSQPATVHGYQIASIVNRIARERSSNFANGQMESPAPISPSLGPGNYRDSLAVALGQKLQNGLNSPLTSRYQNIAASGNSPLPSETPYYDVYSSSADNLGMSANTKKYHSLPDISGLSGPYRDIYTSEKSSQWDNTVGYGATTVGRRSYEPSFYSNIGSGVRGSLAFDGVSKGYGDAFSYSVSSDHGSIWSKQPYEQFGVADKSRAVGSGLGKRSNSSTQETHSPVDSEVQLLRSFRCCIVKLLKLEGSDWLFSQNDGTDEDLIERVAERERCLYEVETREKNHMVHMGEPQYSYSDRKPGSALKNDEAGITNILVSSVPNCGEGCVWKADLITSFGVWCIHRILDLSLMESRPELWGKYTYVLNRLQGIIDVAFSKPRNPMPPCFCLQLSAAYQRRSSPPVMNGMLPPAAKPGKGKSTTASTLLDLIKDVEIAISCRKGRSGTAAGDVAFPKGKENLASVLKRYKRRLSNKLIGNKGGV
ncbi:ethylene-insensitive protein 2 isoform X2 [Manihot esculenta]|uniref:ethylene-insensitive protein 2 isoform X2 n=1 Tax=Manihot esculenta TaxID=3983 RepID=UPI000B5D5AC1|nr:ethylene-insensitive protein 2 isoform X2 [Manihot esculenta]